MRIKIKDFRENHEVFPSNRNTICYHRWVEGAANYSIFGERKAQHHTSKPAAILVRTSGMLSFWSWRKENSGGVLGERALEEI